MVQTPLVNIGDLIWVKIKLGKDHYTSLTAFVFDINFANNGSDRYVTSYYAEYLNHDYPKTTALYGFDFNDVWGKIET